MTSQLTNQFALLNVNEQKIPHPKVQKVIDRDTLKQRSESWYNARKTCITASNVSSLLVKDDLTCNDYIDAYGLQDVFDKNSRCANPYGSKTQFYLDKCKGSNFKGNLATQHGIKYEPVVISLYERKFDTQILEFGLIKHETIDWLAASPDGITPDGTMIEIKCPLRRKITGIPSFVYWIQVQQQLEVCNLDNCDFVEAEFMEFLTEEEWLDTENVIDKEVLHAGLLIQINILDDEDLPITTCSKYIYPPKEILDDYNELIKWKNNEVIKQKDKLSDRQSLTIVYWKIVEWSIVNIKRSKKWFEGIKPVLEKEWKMIQFYQKNNNYKLLENKRPVSIRGDVLHLGTGEVNNICFLSDTSDEDSSED